MTSQAFNTADELRRIIGDGRISDDALQSITGISGDSLSSLLRESPCVEPGLSASPSVLSGEETARLSGLTAQLTEGFSVDVDIRLTGIIESLTAQCHLTHANIALLTRIGLDDLEMFLGDPNAVSSETKFELAVRASYLINAAANASPHPARP
jgi:hypothetical protein